MKLLVTSLFPPKQQSLQDEYCLSCLCSRPRLESIYIGLAIALLTDPYLTMVQQLKKMNNYLVWLFVMRVSYTKSSIKIIMLEV